MELIIAGLVLLAVVYGLWLLERVASQTKRITERLDETNRRLKVIGELMAIPLRGLNHPTEQNTATAVSDLETTQRASELTQREKLEDVRNTKILLAAFVVIVLVITGVIWWFGVN